VLPDYSSIPSKTHIYDQISFPLIYALQGQGERDVIAVAFNPDGRRLVSDSAMGSPEVSARL